MIHFAFNHLISHSSLPFPYLWVPYLITSLISHHFFLSFLSLSSKFFNLIIFHFLPLYHFFISCLCYHYLLLLLYHTFLFLFYFISFLLLISLSPPFTPIMSPSILLSFFPLSPTFPPYLAFPLYLTFSLILFLSLSPGCLPERKHTHQTGPCLSSSL